MQVAELKANSSNNTVFADDKGEIAYLHPQFVPRRDDRFDYTKPVDGSDPRDRLGGAASVWRAAERDQSAQRLGQQHQRLAVSRGRAHSARSPRNFPAYHGHGRRELSRGIHAHATADRQPGRWTLERLQARPTTARSRRFDVLVPMLLQAYARACRRTIRAALGSPGRSRRCALGLALGGRIGRPTRSPISGATSLRRLIDRAAN